MTAAVEKILAEIKQLDATQREELDDALRLEAYREYQRLAQIERAKFADQGVTEEDIDRAISELRYGAKAT